MTTPLLSVRDLAVQVRGRLVFRGVSFDLRAGQTLGVAGANGAGKSLLLRALAGSVNPSEGDARIKQEADQRLASIEQRMPRLNIQLAAGVPADAQVFRDDVPLGRVSLATALPTNPGEHKITVKAPGREDWNYKLKLSEKDNQVLTARVGPVSKTPPKTATDVTPPAPPETAAAAPPPAANQNAFAEPSAPPPAPPKGRARR